MVGDGLAAARTSAASPPATSECRDQVASTIVSRRVTAVSSRANHTPPAPRCGGQPTDGRPRPRRAVLPMPPGPTISDQTAWSRMSSHERVDLRRRARPAPVISRRQVPGDRHRRSSAGRKVGGRRAMRRGRGSAARVRWSCRPGSSPSSSASVADGPAGTTASASACRPARYWAVINRAQRSFVERASSGDRRVPAPRSASLGIADAQPGGALTSPPAGQPGRLRAGPDAARPSRRRPRRVQHLARGTNVKGRTRTARRPARSSAVVDETGPRQPARGFNTAEGVDLGRARRRVAYPPSALDDRRGDRPSARRSLATFDCNVLRPRGRRRRHPTGPRGGDRVRTRSRRHRARGGPATPMSCRPGILIGSSSRRDRRAAPARRSTARRKCTNAQSWSRCARGTTAPDAIQATIRLSG